MQSEKPPKHIGLQECLAKGRRSRREMLTSLLGAAGTLAFTSQLRAHSGKVPPSIDPQLLKGLQIAKVNSNNMAAVFKPKTGFLASFGPNNLFHVDLPTQTFELFINGTKMFEGSAKDEASGDFTKIALENTFTHTLDIEAEDGSEIRIVLELEPEFDATPLSASKPSLFVPESGPFSGTTFRAILRVGLPKHDPTYRLETIYNAAQSFFPLGLETSGSLPSFNHVPLIFASRAIGTTFPMRVMPNSGDNLGAHVGGFWGRTAECVGAALACAACLDGCIPCCEVCALLTSTCLGSQLSLLGFQQDGIVF
jgi:hypothetical protein